MNRRQLPTHQTIQLTDWCFTGLADVPHLDAAFASGINVFSGRWHCNRAHHLPVRKCRHLTRVTRYARTHQRVRRKGHRLHLTLRRNMEWICSEIKLVHIRSDVMFHQPQFTARGIKWGVKPMSPRRASGMVTDKFSKYILLSYECLIEFTNKFWTTKTNMSCDHLRLATRYRR